MTKTEIARRKVVNYCEQYDRIAAEQAEAGKRYLAAAKDSKEEIIAFQDLAWATTKMTALKEKGL